VTSCAWTGVQTRKTYDWYVRVTDGGGNSVTTSPWRFTTKTKFAVNTAPTANGQLATVPGDVPAALTLTGSDADGDPLTYQITSQPLGGMVKDFDPNDGSVTYLPARGYRGPDRIIFVAHDGITNSPPATLNLIITAPQDSNANGLPDEWEAAYGITDPNADHDHDGHNNLAEYRANTNPTNADSALRILAMEFQPGGDLDLTWASVGGTRYRVQYTDGDADHGPGGLVDILRSIDEEMDTAPYGEESTQSFTHTTVPASGARYYRVRLVP
jgi:hypothetical protein